MKQLTYWWFFIVSLFLISAYLHSKDLIREGNKGDVSYEPDDLDIEYHISIDDLIEQDQIRGVARVVDSSGNLIDLSGNFSKTPVYYQPGYKDKSSLANYIPDYEDSMYLSKTHGVFIKKDEEVERGMETELKQKYGKDVTTLMTKRAEQREQYDLDRG